jgi:hypothetical protein
MAKDLTTLLAQHHIQRDLITLRRDDIDDAGIQGYVLALSPTLVVLQYVCDFHLDGLMVLRRGDITDVNGSRTDRLQREMLAREGVEQRVPFDKAFDLADWHAVIGQLSREFPLMILECEDLDDPDFVIGRVHALRADQVDFEHFSGAANWQPELAEIDLDDITCCQVDSNYINFYRRHFERLALS